MHSCIGYIYFIFLQCAFSNVSSNWLPQKKHSRIGCICLTFLHCAFSDVSSNGFYEKRHSHIDCICLTFLHCAFSNVSLKCLHKRMQCHIGCICLTFLHCVISNASSNGLYLKIHSRIGCIYATQRQYFSSGFSHLHPPNQDNNQDFAPLPLLCLFFPNCCFKLSQIYHWLFVSNNHNCLLSITYFHFFII